MMHDDEDQEEEFGRINSVLSKLPSRFIISSISDNNGEKNKVILPARIKKTKIKYYPGKYIYTIVYAGKDIGKYAFPPFKVEFWDPNKFTVNNNCYIAYIHRTDKYSGTQIVCTLLKFLKKIGVKKAFLHDGSYVRETGSSLSLIKLLSVGRTFYSKFGFDFSFSDSHLLRAFGSKKRMKKVFTETLDRIADLPLFAIENYNKKILKVFCDSYLNNSEFDVHVFGDIYDKGDILIELMSECINILSFCNLCERILNKNAKDIRLKDIITSTELMTSNNCGMNMLLSGERFIKQVNKIKSPYYQIFEVLFTMSHMKMYMDLSIKNEEFEKTCL